MLSDTVVRDMSYLQPTDPLEQLNQDCLVSLSRNVIDHSNWVKCLDSSVL